MPATIEISQVSRRYGAKTAVDNLSLEIRHGEVFAFLGPNGAGKTTTIKMMVGLLQADAGAISLCGYDTRAQPRESRQVVGYVPDEPYLYEKLSGREFLQFIAEMYGLKPDEARQGIEEQMEVFGLRSFIDQLTEGYSHGMKQRVALASARLHKPPILVVDEPMVGLDPRSMRLVKNLFRADATAGTTVFMSTHTLAVAEEIADRVGIIDGGRLRFLGTTTELRGQMEDEHSSLEELFLRLTEVGET